MYLHFDRFSPGVFHPSGFSVCKGLERFDPIEDRPTSFSMQRVAHLGHHRRNRTDQDLYDYYLPHQKKWLRNVWLYAGNLLGMYWASIPLMGLIYLVAPIFWCSSLFVERIAPLLGFGPYVAELARLPVRGSGRKWPWPSPTRWLSFGHWA